MSETSDRLVCTFFTYTGQQVVYTVQHNMTTFKQRVEAFLVQVILRELSFARRAADVCIPFAKQQSSEENTCASKEHQAHFASRMEGGRY